MRSLTFLLATLPLLASAHFRLDYPKVRGFDEDGLATFPCGKQDTPSAERTPWPVGGGPINLNMGHSRTLLQVFLGLGNNPGVNFNITLLPTIQEEGVKQFCLSGVKVPSGVGVVGQNATIQVVSNGDPSGGLYNCADITFVAANSPQFSAPSCTNATGVQVVSYNGKAQANGSQPTGASTTASGSGSATAASASATKSGGASALRIEGSGGVFGGLVAAGAVAFAAFL